jgi:hypothetical protein
LPLSTMTVIKMLRNGPILTEAPGAAIGANP